MSNIITIRCWAGKVKEFHFQPGKQKNGMPFPFVKNVRYNADGSTEMILSEAERNSEESKYFIPEDLDIVVTDGTTFDLDNPLHANIWATIKDSDLIVPSRDSKDEHGNLKIDGDTTRYGLAELWIDIPGEESQKSVSRKKLLRQAYEYIENDSLNGLLTKCKLLGKTGMTNAPASDVQDYLYTEAESNPSKVINLYTDGDTKLRLLIIDAKSKYVIKKENGLFMYGDTVLGASDDAILSFLKVPNNKAVFDLIKFATYPEFAKIQSEEVVEKPSKKAK